MSEADITPSIVRFLGIGLPAPRVSINVHGLTIEQCEQAVVDATAAGLSVERRNTERAAWLDITDKRRPKLAMTVFLPDVPPRRESIVPGDKNIEITCDVPPSAEVQLQDDMDRSLLAAAPVARMFGGEQ